MRYVFLLLFFVIAGCQPDAVVFAPTPLPPDLSPVRYQHAGGAFSLSLPRDWAVHEQNTSTLVSAYFTPPYSESPIMSVAVVNLQAELPLIDVINAYQSELRPDIRRYQETERQPMGDGSWRFKGVQQNHGGLPQEINTFIQLTGSFVSVIEVLVPEEQPRIVQLESVINSLQVNTASALQPAALATLSLTAPNDLEIVNIATWSTPQGVYFITGEVINRGQATVTDVPIEVVLQSSDGTVVTDSFDTVMGYGIQPGSFAPFSLRFGQGQPEGTTGYTLTAGNDEWRASFDMSAVIYGADVMTWTDELTFVPEEGYLLVTGTVTNSSSQEIYDPVATLTVIDGSRNVIAAAFTQVSEGAFPPGEMREFSISVTEYGGEPVNYIVNVQALADG